MGWGAKPFQERAVGPSPASLTHLFFGGSLASPAGSAQQVSLEVQNSPSAGVIFWHPGRWLRGWEAQIVAKAADLG